MAGMVNKGLLHWSNINSGWVVLQRAYNRWFQLSCPPAGQSALNHISRYRNKANNKTPMAAVLFLILR